MYFLALAADYDGTIAHDGVVEDPTKAALERFKQTDRKLLLVTGRELPDLERRFPDLSIFDRVVAENGALIYDPANDCERTIALVPSAGLVESSGRPKPQFHGAEVTMSDKRDKS